MISMKPRNLMAISRRQLGAVMLMPAPALAQAPSAHIPDELQAAKQRIQRAAEQLRRFKVPPATEPSFAFNP